MQYMAAVEEQIAEMGIYPPEEGEEAAQQVESELAHAHQK